MAKVAVVGGGCAAMAAAFELTRPEQRGRYEVTVYQMGWRLGGKGASGRGQFDRIEEHGLHLWMGFYENSFRLIRECYAELGRDPGRCRIADWRDAFIPANLNTAADRSPRDGWVPWRVLFPAAQGLPGDPSDPAARWTVAGYLVRSVLLVRTLILSLPLPVEHQGRAEGSRPPRNPAAVVGRISRLLRYGELATLGAALEGLRLLGWALRQTPLYPESLLLALHDAIRRAVQVQLEQLLKSDNEVRRVWEIVDLVLAVVRGAVRFRLTSDPRGFDSINDYDCREWLLLNGASRTSVNSAFVRALYDLAFAYEEGDVKRPRIAAGQALRGAVRAFFTYRGAFFWKMRAGMGDVVFAPLYEVLKKRGVRFEFFHRLEAVRIGDGGPGELPHVRALEFDVQARTVGGREYRPLVDVRGLPCWPAEPRYDQLLGGAEDAKERPDFEAPWERRTSGRVTLEVMKDFDFVVLGIGIGAIPHVCRDIISVDSRWQAMVDRVKSVPTQAFQIWLNTETENLGWRHGFGNLSGFTEPFDTWADMSHLADEETWPRRPRAVAYFCSVLADEAGGQGAVYSRRRAQEVKENAIRFLSRDMVHLWPDAYDSAREFRWDLLESGRSGETTTRQRQPGKRSFDAQYWRANVAPSDRYTLALPGSLRYRISPLDTGYDNMTVAGDWTECGFNEGCVEAAVMSGRLAAHALSSQPRLEDIVGFDHP